MPRECFYVGRELPDGRLEIYALNKSEPGLSHGVRIPLGRQPAVYPFHEEASVIADMLNKAGSGSKEWKVYSMRIEEVKILSPV